MSRFTQKTSTLFSSAAIRRVTFALFLVILGAGATLAQSRAYVTNAGSNTVSVIDTVTNTTVATVPVGLVPFGVAVTPNAAFVYVTNVRSANVSVINAGTNTVVATVRVGSAPNAQKAQKKKFSLEL